jgi:hypothetical protein
MPPKYVLIAATIEAFEGRDVAVIDVLGAFLSIGMDEEVIMTLRGRMAELMAKTARNIYRKYITLDANNKPVLYVKLQKALYECLRCALFFYLKLVVDLELKDFKINMHEPCVANKMIEVKQFTVAWHVDDLKLSHMEQSEETKMIDWMESSYGEMRVSGGSIRAYLRMTFKFETPGEVEVAMIDYLKRVIRDFLEVITGSAATPAGDKLSEVTPDEDKKFLDETWAQAFQHDVAQLLCVSSRTHNDIHTTIAFLTTRARAPDEDEWASSRG